LKALKAVLPVVCLSTRILSANKITPKELLPFFDTSIIQYAVESVQASAKNFFLVIHASKKPIKNHLNKDFELEARINSLREKVRSIVPKLSYMLVNVQYPVQVSCVGKIILSKLKK